MKSRLYRIRRVQDTIRHFPGRSSRQTTLGHSVYVGFEATDGMIQLPDLFDSVRSLAKCRAVSKG
jgi:hypothetical protein